MELDTSTWMMIFFVISLVASIWKIYAFLPNKALEDDDTTDEATINLTNLMLNSIKRKNGNLDIDELYISMQEDEDFNSEKYWRFNRNKLKQLLNLYYANNPEISSIEGIYKSNI